MKTSFASLSLAGLALTICLGFAGAAFADDGKSLSETDKRPASDTMLNSDSSDQAVMKKTGMGDKMTMDSKKMSDMQKTPDEYNSGKIPAASEEKNTAPK